MTYFLLLIALFGLALGYAREERRHNPDRTPAARRRCSHPRTEVVESCVTGEPLARLCVTCDRQLGP